MIILQIKKQHKYRLQSQKWSVIFFMTMVFAIQSGAHDGAKQDHIYQINAKYRLYQSCKNDLDGFVEKISGENINYHSLRVDAREALLTRANTGKMSFELMTAPVPQEYTGSAVTFFYYSNISLNLRQPFDIEINGQPLLTFQPLEDGRLQILSNPGAGNAEFILVNRDNAGDGVGAFRLTAPVSLLQRGKPARVKVTGQHMNSNAWFMLFQVKGVVRWLTEAALHETAFNVQQFNEQLLIDAPAHLEGQTVYLVSDGTESRPATFRRQGELSKASVTAVPPKRSLEIVYTGGEINVTFADGNGETSKSEIIGPFFYYAHAHHGNGWSASLSKLYRPEYFEAFVPFFDKKYKKGLLSMMNSSHQDIAWVDRPEACIIMRDTMLLTPIVRDAFVRDDYGFDIEDGLMLREYLIRHPDAKGKISELLNRKLISVGATYNCPYEDMYYGEDLVRQLYLGKRWVKKTFDGYDSKVYWNVDVPGKTLQMPQILKKAGVDYMVISRHAKGMFHWVSPDGSAVFAYSPGHYGNDVVHLSSEVGNQIKYGAEQVVWWSPYYKGTDTHAPLLSSADMLPAIDYSNFIETWNRTDRITDMDENVHPLYLPYMELMTVDEFMPLAASKVTAADTLKGERPNVWVYIHGPAHHDALTASREASKLLPAAEKFSVVASLLDAEKMPYPESVFDEAWQAKIYPDHGWGGHDGDITDDLFKANLVKSRVMGDQLLQRSTSFIAQRVKSNAKEGMPVMVFNSLSWKRSDPVTISVQLPGGKAKGLEVYSGEGQKMASQLVKVVRYADGSIKEAELVLIAEDVPSVGYKTFYVKPAGPDAGTVKSNNTTSKYENGFYRISFEQGGIAQVYDKELERDLFRTDQLKAGEIFTLQSIGNGAGEFGEIQQPAMEGYDHVSKYKASWEIVADGPVFTTYRLRQPILHAVVEQDVTMYHRLKMVQFENRLLNWDGTLYREFRTAYPVAIDAPLVAHEVPFGRVRVGKDEIHTAGDRYTTLCKDVHPRAIMDWISASDDQMTVMLSSSVAAADWVNPAGNDNGVLLQHVLLASRTSCHWEGNEYSQGGSHYYRHILTSNATGEMAGVRLAKQFNEPLRVIVNPERSSLANLPEAVSFFNIDKENIFITTIKKAEDSDDIIIRMYDAAGESAVVGLDSYFSTSGHRKTNIIEEEAKTVNVLEVPPYSIETFRISAERSYNR